MKFIVCNADEGDPGAYIDKYLMEKQPHSVLLGMMVAGWFAGAETGILYIRAEYPDSVRIVNDAIAEQNCTLLVLRLADASSLNASVRRLVHSAICRV